MSQYLDGGILGTGIIWCTKLGAYLICAGDGVVSSETKLSIVASLLSEIRDEVCSINAGLRYWNLAKDSSPSRDVDWYGSIHTLLGRGRAEQCRKNGAPKSMHGAIDQRSVNMTSANQSR